MTRRTVTVVGLGAMGTTIAELFMKAGARVTVWNRSAGKAASLVERGALEAPDLPAAIAASEVTIVIVSNDQAVSELLATPGVAGAVAGRALIQLTTISPETARQGAEFARKHGVAYLSGAIQAAPSQMGQPDTPLLVSGDERAWAAHRDLLGTLAGGLVYLGADPGAAATMDLATLSWVYGGFVGFLQGALIARAQKVDVAEYGKIVRSISPSFGAFFAHEGGVLQSGNYAVSESPLRISIDATQRLLETAERSGLSTELPALVSSLFQRAAQRGLANEEVAALIKVMESTPSGVSPG
jgi:3-hydroxyisobutyrate dehydrogenase-like beta-hydroxyacid dehydrogenase